VGPRTGLNLVQNEKYLASTGTRTRHLSRSACNETLYRPRRELTGLFLSCLGIIEVFVFPIKFPLKGAVKFNETNCE
jgi:hypothetical protein